MPKRTEYHEIERFIVCFRAAAQAHPMQRITQVLVNALGEDPFYMDNDHAAEMLEKYAAMDYQQ